MHTCTYLYVCMYIHIYIYIYACGILGTRHTLASSTIHRKSSPRHPAQQSQEVAEEAPEHHRALKSLAVNPECLFLNLAFHRDSGGLNTYNKDLVRPI